MTIFEQRLELIQDRLDRAVEANIAKYPESQFDFSNTSPRASRALGMLRDAIFEYAANKLTEGEVKPRFIQWISAIRNAQSAA